MNHQGKNSPSASSSYSQILKLAEDTWKSLLGEKTLFSSWHVHIHTSMQYVKFKSLQQNRSREGRWSLKGSLYKSCQKNKTAHKDWSSRSTHIWSEGQINHKSVCRINIKNKRRDQILLRIKLFCLVLILNAFPQRIEYETKEPKSYLRERTLKSIRKRTEELFNGQRVEVLWCYSIFLEEDLSYRSLREEVKSLG